jgi:dihydrofolate reductase
MRFSAFCGVSVDGFLARPDDTFDFLKAGGGVPHGFTEFLDSVDMVVMGRRTFDVVRTLGHLELYGKKPLVVLSSQRLDFSSVEGQVEQMSGTPQEIAAQLENRGFKHAYVDGGITIQRFLQAGLVNRITVTRVPVLIGQGIPLFGPLPHDVHLRHVATRSLDGGMVQSEYDI